MPTPRKALTHVSKSQDRYLDEYIEFLRIPSVSTLVMHADDMQRAATWVADQMRTIGLANVQVMPTARHPLVYGDWLNAGADKPTVLVYGHYDVQPVDPLNEWVSGPFEPEIRGENLYARGASDMKGQVHAFLKALEALIGKGELAVNVKVLVEGEEEIGSPSLPAFFAANPGLVKCDIVLNADSGILGPQTPSMVYGLRGLAYFELQVYGPSNDLHSGTFGGTILNPAQALVELVAGMHDKKGRITLPGFYDKVRKLSAKERRQLTRLPHTDESWLAMTGAPALYGEAKFSTLERAGARPTLEVNGLLSGFTGEGSKTVLPAKAMAKISMRLIPDQDHDEVEQQLRQYLTENAPPAIRWEVKAVAAGNRGALIPTDTVWMKAAGRALKDSFGVKPVFELAGGSVPIVTLFKEVLGVDSVMLGFGMRDDNIHGPNEKQHLPNYFRGIETYVRFFGNL
jgi:acetylornithine deacetylase/succinyl-diaminopimelate desuccinylase-like protein